MSGATFCKPCGVTSGEWREHRPDCPEYPHPKGPVMTEETATRTRRKNPLVEYEKARAFADKARRAAARAVDLAAKARVAAEKADVLTSQLGAAEEVEQEALTALQDHLAGLRGSDTDTVEGDDEGGLDDWVGNE